MRVALEKNIDSPIASFTVLELKEPFFDPHWHFHPHYQLFTVLEGHGTRLIGDHIQHFDQGDTVLLGPNMPHLWRSDKVYFETNSNLRTHGLVIYFTADFLGTDFFDKPEMSGIQHLLSSSNRGLEITGAAQQNLIHQLKRINHVQGFEATLLLLKALNDLSNSTENTPIASVGYTNTHKVSETERMHKVYAYAMNHFKRTIKLSEIARLANMSPPAFCRYFRKRANKTFFRFLAEVRIGHSCKLLSDSELNVAQIAFESGFNTLSNFNRTFKEIMNSTPSEYKNQVKRGK